MVWAKAFATRRMVLLGLFIAYLVAIKQIGFLVATGVFGFVTIMTLAPRRDLRTIVIAALASSGTLALIYVLLVVYLQAFLP
jgi:hypothetical protein